MVELAPVPSILAIVAGRPLTELPTDLFIPPDALEVLLDSFSGPLDLLLYLIRQQNIDIMDIPMVMITQQYMQYIDLLEERRMELAADYLVMAALLAEIKSRLLLPAPRMELVKRLQAYEQFKRVAMLIDELPRFERDVFQVQVNTDNVVFSKALPDIALSSLVLAMVNFLQRQEHLTHHQITREVLSVRERMSVVLERLGHKKQMEFTGLLYHHEGRMGLVVTFLAILELARQSLVMVTQTGDYAPIHLQARGYDG